MVEQFNLAIYISILKIDAFGNNLKVIAVTSPLIHTVHSILYYTILCK